MRLQKYIFAIDENICIQIFIKLYFCRHDVSCLLHLPLTLLFRYLKCYLKMFYNTIASCDHYLTVQDYIGLLANWDLGLRIYEIYFFVNCTVCKWVIILLNLL